VTDAAPAPGPDRTALIRIGGIATLAGIVIHIVLNMVLKEFPSEDLTGAQLAEYFAAEQSNWTIIHGMRYVAFACMVLFAASLFARTCLVRERPPIGWGIVGLLGAGIFVTSGMITNGIEALAFLGIDGIADRPDLFWALFSLTRVLFTAEVVAWGIFIFGFSVAGWCSRRLPRWIAALGFAHAAAAMLSGVFIVSILTDGPASVVIEVASLSGLAWFLCAALFLSWRGGS